MKKLLLFSAMALCVVSLMSFSAGEKAEFKFDFETHDFGKIPQGTPVTVVFKFTNVGDEPLIITGASAPCGCTKPKYDDKPILKGEEGAITVTFNAATLGIFNKSVTVMSNGTIPTKFLYIKGEVVK